MIFLQKVEIGNIILYYLIIDSITDIRYKSFLLE